MENLKDTVLVKKPLDWDEVKIEVSEVSSVDWADELNVEEENGETFEEVKTDVLVSLILVMSSEEETDVWLEDVNWVVTVEVNSVLLVSDEETKVEKLDDSDVW